MKSFDEMADEYVDKFATASLPKVLTESDRKVLWVGYFAGLGDGIKYCVDGPAMMEDKQS